MLEIWFRIKVLRDLSRLMSDAASVVNRYEQTLDANEHFPENDLMALKKQEAVLKVGVARVLMFSTFFMVKCSGGR